MDAMLPVLFVPANADAVLAAASPTNVLAVGVCAVYSSSIAPNDTPYPGGLVFDAATALHRILGKNMIDLDKPLRVDVNVMSQPKHGQLTVNRFPDGGATFNYRSDIGYLGKENFSLLVKIEGQPPVKLVYFFTVVQGGPDDKEIIQYCGTKKLKLWKISESDFNSGSQDYAAWLRSAELSSLLANAGQSLTDFQDLTGSSVGQTTGEGANASITLDTTAAGHGWYVDPTPLDNTDDYLPTSNPNIWQAKAGSDAAGKMDMLSVLLHAG